MRVTVSRDYCYLLYTMPPVTTNKLASTKKENILIMIGCSMLLRTKKKVGVFGFHWTQMTQRVDYNTDTVRSHQFWLCSCLKKYMKNAKKGEKKQHFKVLKHPPVFLHLSVSFSFVRINRYSKSIKLKWVCGSSNAKTWFWSSVHCI